jgi:hypothetical protein
MQCLEVRTLRLDIGSDLGYINTLAVEPLTGYSVSLSFNVFIC